MSRLTSLQSPALSTHLFCIALPLSVCPPGFLWNKKQNLQGVGDVSQLIECLSSRHKALGSIPSISHKLGMVASASECWHLGGGGRTFRVIFSYKLS